MSHARDAPGAARNSGRLCSSQVSSAWVFAAAAPLPAAVLLVTEWATMCSLGEFALVCHVTRSRAQAFRWGRYPALVRRHPFALPRKRTRP